MIFNICSCGNTCEYGRKICKKCRCIQAKERYKENGRYYINGFCEYCGEKIKIQRKGQRFCLECYRYINKCNGDITTNKYIMTNIPGLTLHAKIVKEQLGRELFSNERIHHIDGNCKNNSFDNLIVLSDTAHVKLHRLLKEKIAFAKRDNLNIDILNITEEYIKSKGIKVIRLV